MALYMALNHLTDDGMRTIKKAPERLEGSKRAADYALELLEQVLPRDIREAFLPLLEDLPVEEKARRLRKWLAQG